MVLTIASILLATVLGVIGQLMLKQGMASMGVLQFSAGAVPSILLRMATSPWVIGGLLVYGSGTFFWLLVLNRVPLSYSYPFIALGIVVGFLAAWIIFRESIPPSRWLGMAVIVAGLLLVART
jgi:multidrug transporter EmrE-like cation transporter